MYYINEEQIEVRLNAIPAIADTVEELLRTWNGSMVHCFAHERALHMAVEIVTDVGSYLIDGFLMRDASSYEDIMEITGAEGCYPPEITAYMLELVKLRRPLVQDYFSLQRGALHPLAAQLPGMLRGFGESVRSYLAKELRG